MKKLGNKSNHTIMIKVKENGKEEGERNSKKNIANTNVPKMNQPSTVSSRKERFADGKRRHMNIPHVANMHESGEENKGKRRPIVIEESTDNPHEQCTVTQFSADVTTHEHEKSDHNAQISSRFTRRPPLPRENLHAFLEIDQSNVEAEYIARETGYICKTVAGIGYGKEPMHDQRPASMGTIDERKARCYQAWCRQRKKAIQFSTYIPIHVIKARKLVPRGATIS